MESQNENKLNSKLSLPKDRILKAALISLGSLIVIVVAIIIKFYALSRLVLSRPMPTYIGISFVCALLLLVMFVYTINTRKSIVSNIKEYAAIMTAFTFSLVVCLCLSHFGYYFMPVALTAFIIAPLSLRRDAFIYNIFTNLALSVILIMEAVLSNQMNENIIFMFINGIVTGTIAAYTVSNDAKRVNYILKGFLIVIISATLIFIFSYVDSDPTEAFMSTLPAGVIAATIQLVLGLLMQPILEGIFNLLTNARLVEFTDHNSPLIKRLITETPGTFNHCLAVANFAEICAGAIGENPYLARACAYYHDIGKLTNPSFFKENQADINPHDEILPEVSADIIRGHTTEGLELCKEYRIPHEISHVTIQHHGTLPIYMFYKKAQNLTDNEVDINDYSYRGITPVTKVAAIIMICDSGEAAIRAMDKPDGVKVDALVKKLIEDRIKAGQFDDCEITLKDLDAIRAAIVGAYGGLYHKRLKYPDGK